MLLGGDVAPQHQIQLIVLSSAPGDGCDGIVGLTVREGDNTDAACFIYEEQEDSVRITGLSEEGKNRGVLTIPTTYNGKAITAFDVTVFSENIRITQVTIQSNVQILYNGSFNGCNRLQKIVLKHTSPNTIGVGVNLLQGAENCYIYVPNTVLDIFATHYNWGAYRNVLRGY
jgi:hypothetical protein